MARKPKKKGKREHEEQHVCIEDVMRTVETIEAWCTVMRKCLEALVKAHPGICVKVPKKLMLMTVPPVRSGGKGC